MFEYLSFPYFYFENLSFGMQVQLIFVFAFLVYFENLIIIQRIK